MHLFGEVSSFLCFKISQSIVFIQLVFSFSNSKMNFVPDLLGDRVARFAEPALGMNRLLGETGL